MKTKNNHTVKKLIYLIIVFLLGFIVLFSLNQVFTKLIYDLDKKTTNLESRLTISEFITYDIIKIRTLFSELATTTTSEKSRILIKNDIESSIKTTKSSLAVIKNGGILERKVYLNIAGHLNTTKKITYKKDTKESFSIEAIDIEPKLNDIKIMMNELDTMLMKRDTLLKQKKIKEKEKIERKIRRYYKSLPAFFNRMSENIQRLLYEGEIDLNRLNKKIEHDKIKYLQLKILLIVVIIFIVLLLGYAISKNINEDSKNLHILNIDLHDNLKKQEKQKKSIRAILDAQPNIIIVSDGENMRDANTQLFKFLNDYNTLKEFNQDYSCICDMFENDVPNDEYIQGSFVDNIRWTSYILLNPDKNYKAIIKQNGKKNHFSIEVSESLIDEENNESVVIITLHDITQEIISRIKLKNLNENLEIMINTKTAELQTLNENLEQRVVIESKKVFEKDRILMEQSKLAAMGDMIGNIAHQWRQPLSVISTGATGMMLQKEYGCLSDAHFNKTCTAINDNAQYLSKTIDDFRNFIKGDGTKKLFLLKNTINSFLNLVEGSIKSHTINVISMIESDIQIDSYENELTQCLINIFNNAKDALAEKNIEKKFIFITTSLENDIATIKIRDNALGISDQVINKIFEPYFTTKHQSQGTGLGLHMTYNLIVDGLCGTIEVDNLSYDYEEKNYTGAEFVIRIPTKSKS